MQERFWDILYDIYRYRFRAHTYIREADKRERLASASATARKIDYIRICVRKDLVCKLLFTGERERRFFAPEGKAVVSFVCAANLDSEYLPIK